MDGAASTSAGLAVAAFLFCALALYGRARALCGLKFKPDLARPRGDPPKGVLYALTLSLLPWAKESTRQHWAGYLRGILFHLGIFGGLGMLLMAPSAETASPAVRITMAAIISIGLAGGLIGLGQRVLEVNLRTLSNPDDYASVLLVNAFMAMALWTVLRPEVAAYLYLVAESMFVYIPFSKIRHCLYYFFSRYFFGINFGRRGVLPQTVPQGRWNQ